MNDRFTELLPWYVNGRIAPEDRAWVDAHLRTHPEAASELRWYQSLHGRIRENEPAVSDEIGLDRALAKIRAETRTQTVRRVQQAPSFMERVREWLAEFGMTPAMAAAAAIIAVQGVVILNMARTTAEDDPYGPRTIKTAPITDQQLLKVNFRPDAKEADIRLLLVEINGDLVRGPGQLGDYYLNVPKGQLDKASAKLKVAEIVEAVAVVPGLPERN
jgi:hypothetical protein